MPKQLWLRLVPTEYRLVLVQWQKLLNDAQTSTSVLTCASVMRRSTTCSSDLISWGWKKKNLLNSTSSFHVCRRLKVRSDRNAKFHILVGKLQAVSQYANTVITYCLSKKAAERGRIWEHKCRRTGWNSYEPWTLSRLSTCKLIGLWKMQLIFQVKFLWCVWP